MTFPFEDTFNRIMQRFEEYFPTQEWGEPDKVMRPYISGKECKYMTVMYHPNHAEFGISVQITGQQWSEIRAAGHYETDVLEKMLRDGGRPTRLDLAIDLFNHPTARPMDVYTAWRSKQLYTHARKLNLVQSVSDTAKVSGETVYIGSRQSEKLIRVYDKAAQQQKDGKWVRLELELKGSHAEAAAKAAVQKDTRVTALSYLRSVVSQSGVSWIESMFSSDIEIWEPVKLGRKETDFEKWFWKIVFPAVEKAITGGLPGAREALKRALADENMKHGTH